MISTLIYNAKFGDKLAMEQLLHKFHPLLKKYANKLKYEDALSELTLFFIELVHKIPMQMLQSANEGKLVKYIDSVGVQGAIRLSPVNSPVFCVILSQRTSGTLPSSALKTGEFPRTEVAESKMS